MSSQKDELNALGEQLKGLDPVKNRHEIESVKLKIINIIYGARSLNFYKGFVSLEYMAEDIVDDALLLMIFQRKELDRYDPEKSSLSYYITDRIKKRIREVEKKEKNKHYIKVVKEVDDDADTLKLKNAEAKKKKIEFIPPDSLDKEIFTDDGRKITLGEKIKGDHPGPDKEAISPQYDMPEIIMDDMTEKEPMFQLASLIIGFINKPSGKVRNHYYELFYTEAVVADLKTEIVTRDFRYIHERDIIGAVFLQYLNFMLAKKPDGSDKFAQKADVSSAAIGISHLELNKNVIPDSYNGNVAMDAELSIPIRPFVLLGYLEKKEGKANSGSLKSTISSYRNKFMADVFDLFKKEPS